MKAGGCSPPAPLRARLEGQGTGRVRCASLPRAGKSGWCWSRGEKKQQASVWRAACLKSSTGFLWSCCGFGELFHIFELHPGRDLHTSELAGDPATTSAVLKAPLTRKVKEKLSTELAFQLLVGLTKHILFVWFCSGAVMENLGCNDTLKPHSSAQFCYLWCRPGQNLLRISKPREKRSLSFLVLIQHLPQRWFCLGLPGIAGA